MENVKKSHKFFFVTHVPEWGHFLEHRQKEIKYKMDLIMFSLNEIK